MKKIVYSKKVIVAVLSIVLAMTVPLGVLASSDVETRKYTYEELPDNVPLCYVNGVAVYKENVDENFRITLPETVQPRTVLSHYVSKVISASHRGEDITVTGSFSSYQLYQKDTFYYITEDHCEELATRVEEETDYDVVSAILGMISGIDTVGGFYGTVMNLLYQYKGSRGLALAEDIRSYANSGVGVVLNLVESDYGDFVYLYQWNMSTCIYSGKVITPASEGYMGVATQTAVTEVVCAEHGSRNIWIS